MGGGWVMGGYLARDAMFLLTVALQTMGAGVSLPADLAAVWLLPGVGAEVGL